MEQSSWSSKKSWPGTVRNGTMRYDGLIARRDAKAICGVMPWVYCVGRESWDIGVMLDKCMMVTNDTADVEDHYYEYICHRHGIIRVFGNTHPIGNNAHQVFSMQGTPISIELQERPRSYTSSENGSLPHIYQNTLADVA